MLDAGHEEDHRADEPGVVWPWCPAADTSGSRCVLQKDHHALHMTQGGKDFATTEEKKAAARAFAAVAPVIIHKASGAPGQCQSMRTPGDNGPQKQCILRAGHRGVPHTDGEQHWSRCPAWPKNESTNLADAVNHPPHYTAHPSGVECIQIAEHMCFNLGNALKYIWRCDLKKDAIEDLEKSIWYIQREIDLRKRITNGEAK